MTARDHNRFDNRLRKSNSVRPPRTPPLRRRLSRVEPFDLPGEAGLDVEALVLQGRGHERRFDRPGLGRPRNRARRRVGGIALHRRPDPRQQEVGLRLQRPRFGLVGERHFLARPDLRVERGSALCPSADWRLADPSKRGFVPTKSTARVDVLLPLQIQALDASIGREATVGRTAGTGWEAGIGRTPRKGGIAVAQGSSRSACCPTKAGLSRHGRRSGAVRDPRNKSLLTGFYL